MFAEKNVVSDCTVTNESFETMRDLWHGGAGDLQWHTLCMLPPWLQAWWKAFGGNHEPFLWTVWEDDVPVGLAPCRVESRTVRWIGSSDVCDYLDAAVRPGKEAAFFATIIRYARDQGMTDLLLESLRPDSITLRFLPAVAENLGCSIAIEQEDTAVTMALPQTWEAFLDNLSGKQRHEVRRKLRRLEEAGPFEMRLVGAIDEISEAMDIFFRLFTADGEKKAHFLTAARKVFFGSLIAAMAEEGLLRLFFLEINKAPAAAALCFDHRSTRYLYNSGYDRCFRGLSAGLLCKVLSIKDGVHERCRYYDFMKGTEAYKSRLGGRPLPLYRCRISLCD